MYDIWESGQTCYWGQHIQYWPRTDICNCLLGNVSSAAIVCKLLIPYHFEEAKQYLGGYVNKIWKIFANVEIGNVEIGWNGYKLIK